MITALRRCAIPAVVLTTLMLTSCSLGLTSDTSTRTSVPSATATNATATATMAPSSTATKSATGTTAAIAPTAPVITTAPQATTATTLNSAPTTPNGQLLSVTEINKQARAAVVQITNSQRMQTRGSTSGAVVPTGVGTGFIYDKRGYILTNNHVIDAATTITVTTTDDKTYDAKLIGAYPDGDIAVIQITGDNLPTVPLGDSTKLQVGDPVVAIGNALALAGGPTVTSGVVSALGRTEQEPSDGPQPGAFLVDLIQTDAAINPGNSGGPLFNGSGEVIGINTLGAGQAEAGVQAQGIGFAISINQAKSTADALVAGQPVPRPYMGIVPGQLSATQRTQAGLAANSGIGVASVQQGSPAEKAGIQANDIIVKINGQNVRGQDGFSGLLLKQKPGDTITVTIQRGRDQRDVQVTLAQYPRR